MPATAPVFVLHAHVQSSKIIFFFSLLFRSSAWRFFSVHFRFSAYFFFFSLCPRLFLPHTHTQHIWSRIKSRGKFYGFPCIAPVQKSGFFSSDWKLWLLLLLPPSSSSFSSFCINYISLFCVSMWNIRRCAFISFYFMQLQLISFFFSKFASTLSHSWNETSTPKSISLYLLCIFFRRQLLFISLNGLTIK